ncbi:hypothetical protein [Paraburkholderia lacunae]|uniref:hypothetical protein n=1 Tax=Paraburkholderia lacunae TaxID=2211104 RepID=UPI001058EEC4|nr:hypothetical protein [Paraburkholderia lacunae]
MFDRLLDRINLHGSTPKWMNIVETFKLKYPQVRVHETTVINAIPPGFFWVCRDTKEYVIVLQKNKEELLFHLTHYAQSRRENSGIAKELLREINYSSALWRNRTNLDVDDTLRRAALNNGEILLNWGNFDYKCQGGVGEFCGNGTKNGGTFVSNFVLREDRHLFAKR